MASAPPSPSELDGVVHLIQVALTPVFLLSGIAALLNVFATRLGRVSDHIEPLMVAIKTADADAAASITKDIAELKRRSKVLDVAVVLGALAATFTCAAILTLFLAALLGAAAAAWVLISVFGAAILLTVGSVAAFGVEMLLASQGLRVRLHLRFPGLRHGGRRA